MENTLVNMGQNSIMDNFVKTDDILKDMCGIIESSQKTAYQAVNTALVQRNWLIGYRIAEEEMQGEVRSEYGLQIIKKLKDLIFIKKNNIFILGEDNIEKLKEKMRLSTKRRALFDK